LNLLNQNQPSITVGEFLERAPTRLELKVLAGHDGIDSRAITLPRIQKLGLALAGFTHYIHPGRLQIVGQSEVWFLGQLEMEQRREAIRNLSLEKIACVLVTKNLESPPELVSAADNANLPLLQTPLLSSEAIQVVTDFLQEALAPRITLHGVLLDIYGLGVLMEGESGIGKSECALDLIARGHRLVSDDVIEVWSAGMGRLIGRSPEMLREHLEIRGLGILNIRDLFGVSAISSAKTIDLSIRFERWEDASEVDRLGIDTRTSRVLEIDVPQFLIPVSRGRNLCTLVETAVRVHLLRTRGHNAAQEFVARHTEMMRESSQ